MRWYNEPPTWSEQGSTIRLMTGAKTDFWRKTHDGGIRDNGNFYYREVRGDFTAEVKVTGHYRDLYDQAGLMIRQDESSWLKCGIEFYQEMQQASVVVTRDYSDWSIMALPQNPPSIWLRAIWRLPTIEIYFALDGTTYTMLRQAYLSPDETLQVGVMACSPTGSGFDVTFEDFTISQG